MLRPPKQNHMAMIVRRLRMERGWTQEHLAQLTGLSVRSIQRIERGQSCSLETLNSLAAVFEVERTYFNVDEPSTNDVASANAVDSAEIMYVRSLKGLLSHVYLFGVVAAVVGFAFDFNQPAVFWRLSGWGIGLCAHGLTAFGVLNVFSPDWERRQIKKRVVAQQSIGSVKRRLERRGSVVALQSFIQFGRVSMKIVARLSGSAALLAGVALLAWVSYDATNVMKSLGLQARMDEAAVATLTLLLGAFLVTSGIYIWRRVLRPSNAISA